jgi:hypothetical protein
MKLTKQQQQQWSTVTSVFGAVSRLSADPAVIQGEMANLIADFEVATDHEVKVKIRMLPTPSIDMIDCSRDSLKLSRDAEGSMTLRARVHGVGFSSTVAYKDSYAHSNMAIIDALRALADSLEKMPVEMREQTAQSLDIYQLIGVSHKGGSDEDEASPEEPQKPAEEKPVEEDEFPIQLVSVDAKDVE